MLDNYRVWTSIQSNIAEEDNPKQKTYNQLSLLSNGSVRFA